MNYAEVRFSRRKKAKKNAELRDNILEYSLRIAEAEKLHG